MPKLKQILASRAGKPIATVVALLAVAYGAYAVVSTFGSSAAVDASSHVVYVCSKTGKSFNVKIVEGLTNPVLSPYSGEKTGYPAETCYWTKDGKPKKEPTYVLLNSCIGKPEPTFCPDCGRLVRPRNPMAMEGANPPPTQDQYHRNRGADE